MHEEIFTLPWRLSIKKKDEEEEEIFIFCKDESKIRFDLRSIIAATLTSYWNDTKTTLQHKLVKD